MAEARHKGMGRGLLLQAVAAAVFFVLIAHASTALAALGRNGRAPVYLRAEVSLQYQKDLGRDAGGKKIDGELLKEYVRLTYGAYILDPRLATYVASLTLENQDSSGELGDKSRLVAGSFNVNFFNRINRSRGAGFWKYVPSPLQVGIAHTESTHTVSTSYTLGAYYMLPGYLVLFDGGDWVSYNATGKFNRNNTSNANRYRIKYSDESLNYNRNGNGNWNRNGNGNWNRNGNGNWNRNGNGNWNRNGNGNWNQNSNQNSNGEPGTGNSDSEWQRDANAGEAARKPYIFKFPSLSLNMSRNDVDEKKNNDKGSTTNGDVRAQMSSSDIGGDEYYYSNYELHYHWYETTWDNAADQENRQLDLTADNNWRRLKIGNKFEQYEYRVDRSVTERTSYTGNVSWRDGYSNFVYELNGGVRYLKSSNEELKETYLRGLGELQYAKSRRLSSKLRGDTTARAQYVASRTQGERDYQTESWRLDAAETLVSHHLDHVEARLAGTIGHDRFGTPLTASLSAVTQGLPRLNAFAEYAYTTVISRQSDEEYQKNRFSASCNYYMTIFLELFGRFTFEDYSQVTGGALHSAAYGNYTESEGRVTWRPRAGLSLSGHTLMRTTDYEDYVENGISAIKTLGRRSSMRASATVDTKSTVPGRHEAYNAAYLFNRPKFDFSLEYQNDKWYQGWTENRIYMNIKRIFGRR